MKALAGFFGLLVTAACIVAILAIGLNSIQKEFDEKEELIGKSVVIESDTLMILDWKMLNENYVLSNGLEISYKLAEGLEIIDLTVEVK